MWYVIKYIYIYIYICIVELHSGYGLQDLAGGQIRALEVSRAAGFSG